MLGLLAVPVLAVVAWLAFGRRRRSRGRLLPAGSTLGVVRLSSRQTARKRAALQAATNGLR